MGVPVAVAVAERWVCCQPCPRARVSLPKPTKPEANDLLASPGSLSPGVEHGGVEHGGAAPGEHPSVPPEQGSAFRAR